MQHQGCKIAIFGAGFWSQFQIPAWKEVSGAEVVAICNRTRQKAEIAAHSFGIPRVYDSPEQLLKNESIDVIDILTEVPAHAEQVAIAARHRIPVICQKPMALDYATCEQMVAGCARAKIPFLIHENFRWVDSYRRLKIVLDENHIGTVRRAQIFLGSGTKEIYAAQPFSANQIHSIITDMGCHVFDLIRFYFGQPESVYCHAIRTFDEFPCESIMTVMCRYPSMLCSASLSEHINSKIFIDGEKGTIELKLDNSIEITTRDGVVSHACPPPPAYHWVTPKQHTMYGNCCSQGIVDCHRHLLHAIQTGEPAETSGHEYLKTMNLVYAAVASTETNTVVKITT